MQELIGRFLTPPPGVGPAQFAPGLDTRMADRAQLLALIRQVEQDETLLGAATHFALIAEKPAQDT